ncbi:hypothetical protein SteCoe_28651 [Stentor coeruleus]|uniref:Uncharacterized protein n=1 Tax=Stentor coeruleus TaxID=5963 RepID=A0A1R2B835_9CILI|nr:hypothetical protein SteCoe_28651 [Stentor coeruleus]
MGGRREYDYLFKIVIIGDSGVGKSCLLIRFADDAFSESYITTIGVDFRFRTLTVDETSVKLQIWDTAGQERFKTITTAYYRGSDAIMVVFDKSNADSFNHVDTWMEEVNRYGHENAVKMIIGNKADLGNAVSKEEAEDKARSFGIEYIETSAKSSFQVDLAFMSIARQLVKKRKETGVPPIPRMAKLVLANEDSKSKDKSCC